MLETISYKMPHLFEADISYNTLVVRTVTMFVNLLNLFCSTAFALGVIALTLGYFYLKHVYTYWQRRGVSQLKPSIPFGNFTKSFMQKMAMGDLVDQMYRSTQEPFLGK